MTMQSFRSAIVLVGFISMMGCTESSFDDPIARGEEIHKVCLPCHSTTLYVSPQRRINTLSALREEVARWGDYYNPALTQQEIDDVTAYLNARFYKF